MRCFAVELGSSKSTVYNGLRALEVLKRLGQRLPHQLTDGNSQTSALSCCSEATPSTCWSPSSIKSWSSASSKPKTVRTKISRGAHRTYHFELLRDNTKTLPSRSTLLICRNWPIRSAALASPGKEALRRSRTRRK